MLNEPELYRLTSYLSKEFHKSRRPGYGVCPVAKPSEVSRKPLGEAVHGVYKPRGGLSDELHEAREVAVVAERDAVYALLGRLLLSPSSAYHPLTSILKRRGGAVKKVKLELTFSRYEVYEEKMREVYRPKCSLTFTTAAKEYVRLI